MLNLMSFSPSNFGRYISQNEYSMEESNAIIEQTQVQRKSTTNNIPPLMSLTITPPIMATNNQQKLTIPASVIKENIEPLPFPQHSPGPIQRPNKLSCSSTNQPSSIFTDSTQSPSTPDVLVQINHLLDHQNSITGIPSTPNISTSTTSSTIINDIPTPNIPWTPFAPTEWTSKFDSSWSLTNIQTPSQMQNPFAQPQTLKEASSVWSSTVETPAPVSTASNTRTQHTPEWNEIFSSAVPSSIETTKPINNSWLKFLPVSDASAVEDLPSNTPENEINNPYWNSINLNEAQQNSTTAWWSKPSSDENNNNDNDQSRWDFAR